MRIEARNGMIYDDQDPLCCCRTAHSGGKWYAFIRAIDTGMDGEQRFTKQYWGEYSEEDPAGSIERILLWGGKWNESGPY